MKHLCYLAFTALVAGAQTPVAPPPPSPSVQPKVDRTAKPGVGDLLVAPQRLILEKSARSGELVLQNVGPRTATYRIGFINMAMAEDGTLREIPEKLAGGKYAEDVVRYSPRQVTLEPGATQTLRISLRPSAQSAPGEYRSHLVFRAVPEAEAVKGSKEEAEADGISVRLIPIYGVAIPIVVRIGATSSAVQWESAQYKGGDAPQVEAMLARTGNQTSYGDLLAIYHPAAGGSPVIVGRMTMVGIYPELPRRRFKLLLRFPEGTSPKGTLVLRFQDPEIPSLLLAETRLEIP